MAENYYDQREDLYAARQASGWKLQDLSTPVRSFGPCGCVGPQRGEPLCPCQMRCVQVESGRYVQRIDLGPAPLLKQTRTDGLKA